MFLVYQMLQLFEISNFPESGAIVEGVDDAWDIRGHSKHMLYIWNWTIEYVVKIIRILPLPENEVWRIQN